MKARPVYPWMLALLPLLSAGQLATAQTYVIGDIARLHEMHSAPVLTGGVRAGSVSHAYAQPRLQDYAQRELHTLQLRTVSAAWRSSGLLPGEEGGWESAAPTSDPLKAVSVLDSHRSHPASDGPVAGGKVVAEVLIGALAGGATSLAFAYVGAATIGPQGGEDPGLLGAAVGLVAGATVGSSLGVYGVGCMGEEQGSFAASFVGSALGMGLFMLLRPDPDNNPLFWAGVYGLPAVGATIGFNLARR